MAALKKMTLIRLYVLVTDTCYYAVALVKRSSTFKFSELKNKRSCHTGIGHMAGWYAPLSVLHEKKLLNWTEDEAQRGKCGEKIIWCLRFFF